MAKFTGWAEILIAFIHRQTSYSDTISVSRRQLWAGIFKAPPPLRVNKYVYCIRGRRESMFYHLFYHKYNLSKWSQGWMWPCYFRSGVELAMPSVLGSILSADLFMLGICHLTSWAIVPIWIMTTNFLNRLLMYKK